MAGAIVTTLAHKCKRCYSCVRECPAIAIRVIDGQAFVMEERCIECGHCVKVCSQNAKKISDDIDKVLYDFIPSGDTIAILAPSFSASFVNEGNKVITGLKTLGFKYVTETAFGADLISNYYKKILENEIEKTIISSSCPAVCNLIVKYHPELVENLAEIVSPMIAMGRYLKEYYGDDTKTVFIGPCIAKKSEYIDENVEKAIDAVLTFSELKDIFGRLNINLSSLEDGQFDPPAALLGKSYPLSGGLLKTAGISNDCLNNKVITVEGKEKVIQILEDIKSGKIKNKFIDILFCEGCISGPAMDSNLNYYSRREEIIKNIENTISSTDKNVWKSKIFNSRHIDLKREFKPNVKRRPMPDEVKIREILARSGKVKKEDELNCGACGYHTCREYAIAIAKGLAEEAMCLPYLIETLEESYKELKETKDQLQSAEKLASIGQLAAGVAHELNNPLGTIMLFASMLKRDLASKTDNKNWIEDTTTILEEAGRCKNIVINLLNFARHGKLKISDVNVKILVDKALRSFSVNPVYSDVIVNVNCNTNNTVIQGDAEQLMQLFINIIGNAFEALEEATIKNITVNIKSDDNNITAEVIDTGCGISDENINKLFTPFFTTKKMGKGTGLGLAISYGIIKMHRGEIKAQSKLGAGAVFTIKIPYKNEIQTIGK